MNCLSLALNNAAAQGDFGYHHKCERTKLTHLTFADDLLIFTDGALSSVQGVMAVLKDFEERSGLAISIQKTCFFTGGMNSSETKNITDHSGLSLGMLPICYLGVPLCSKKVSIADCSPLIQSVKSKCRSWTAKALSYAGRLQLISSVINGIKNFWSSAFILPKSVTNEIDSICGKFLWKGKIDEVRNTAKVSWSACCKSKNEGGLGLRNLNSWNLACATKLIWLLFFQPNSIWASWFITEMLQGNINNFWVINKKQKHSWMCNQLLDLRDLVYPWIKIQVGNGETSYFWSSNWSPFEKLSTYLPPCDRLRLPIPQDATLAELWTNGDWILPSARSDYQVNIFSYLTTLSLTNQHDIFEWWPGNSKSSSFSTGSIYNLIRERVNEVTWSKITWFSGGIPRHNFHTWLVILNRCSTRDRIAAWGVPVDTNCLLCDNASESIAHLYFQCDYAWSVWCGVSRRLAISPQRDWTASLAWLETFVASKCKKTLLLLAWQATLYLLWKERNSRLHRNHSSSDSKTITAVFSLVKNRISSLRPDRPRLSSAMMQLWLSGQD